MLNKFNNAFNINSLLIIILFISAFFFNIYYANLGVFPIDTFLHFDSGYRILNNQYPVQDFWVVSGIFVDFLEAFFFSILGTSWKTHIIHSSIFNGAIAILSYSIFLKLELNKFYCFFYSFLISILAYTPSGTPFVDHHATFFSLFAIYFFILAIKFNQNYAWIVFPWFLGFSFLSKQVPAAYFLVLITILLTTYCFFKKTIRPILISFFSSIVFFLGFVLFCEIINLDYYLFVKQYVLYPLSIGSERVEGFSSITLESFINKFKYILIPSFGIILLNYRIFKQNYKNKKIDNIYIFISILTLPVCLILHQVLTKNQIFIYFLVPLLFSFFHIFLTYCNYKFSKIFFLILLTLSTLITFKYHLRFNETRKFHELQNVNLNKSVEAYYLSDKLEGLNWISQKYSSNPKQEINKLKKIIKLLKGDKQKKILITNYLFLSVLLEENLYSPSKTYTLDHASFPLPGNKYYKDYKNYFEMNIKKSNAKNIYLIRDEGLDPKIVTNYLDNDCYELFEEEEFKRFEIKSNCF